MTMRSRAAAKNLRCLAARSATVSSGTRKAEGIEPMFGKSVNPSGVRASCKTFLRVGPLLAIALSGSSGKASSGPAGATEGSELAVAARGKCDDSLKASFNPDRNTSVLLVREFRKGEPLLLQGSSNDRTVVAQSDLCVVKLNVGPGNPGRSVRHLHRLASASKSGCRRRRSGTAGCIWWAAAAGRGGRPVRALPLPAPTSGRSRPQPSPVLKGPFLRPPIQDTPIFSGAPSR